MRTTTSILLFATLGACPRGAELPMHLQRPIADGSPIASIPQYVELHHRDEGWLRVPVEVGEPKLGDLEAGQPVQIALAEVPRGTYDAVRVGTLVAAPAGTAWTVRTAEGQFGPVHHGPGLQHHRTWDRTPFCVDGRPEALTISLIENDALNAAARVVEAPGC